MRHVLYGVDLLTGQIRTDRRSTRRAPSPPPTCSAARCSLSDGVVYVPYGGNFGDCGAYLGRVVGAPMTGDAPLLTFAVPTPREGGIWGPPGPVGLPGGDLLVTTGNGEAVGGDWDHSDSILRLSPTLQLRDGFAPVGWAQENSVDADLGSTGPVLLPGARRVLAAGKGGGVYLADVDRLGGVDGQTRPPQGCHSYGGAAVTVEPGAGARGRLPALHRGPHPGHGRRRRPHDPGLAQRRRQRLARARRRHRVGRSTAAAPCTGSTPPPAPRAPRWRSATPPGSPRPR